MTAEPDVTAEQPTLADDVVTLRPLRSDDVPDIVLGIRAGDRGMAEVGFNCAPWARGQGLTTAAMRLMCAWAFECWPFHDEGLARIQWSAYVGNDGSRRVADNVGFVFEGTQRQGLVQHGVRRDAWVGGLLPGDLA